MCCSVHNLTGAFSAFEAPSVEERCIVAEHVQYEQRRITRSAGGALHVGHGPVGLLDAEVADVATRCQRARPSAVLGHRPS